ncbi:uncharacterized protein LOC114922669 [Protobothrops mucrosquamatus]|uniref:uncharacterized protein LOC114922669 n=1 Tax=Protobothrops mucrosquamatus TaxID=103944 RepID=UPI0010FADBF2|nr:uncharacterized protein LOC114922669 [Protobothrops mucrosquamatus]
MVEKSVAVAVQLVLVSASWLLCPTLVDSTASICSRCPADSEFLRKIQLQIMGLKRPTRDLYKSYLSHMGLQDDLRLFCQLPVAWLPSRNITKKPERLLLQELYTTVVHMERALKALENQHADAEMPLSHQLATVSLSLTGLLSNIQCAHCLRGLRPVPVTPSERTRDSSSFTQKMEGCQVLWNLSSFIRGLAKVFQKEKVKGKRPERQKKKKKKKKGKIHRSFLSAGMP